MNKIQSDLSQLFHILRHDREKIKCICIGERLYSYIKTFCRYEAKKGEKDTMLGIPVERGVLFFENNYELIYKEVI